MYQQVNNLTAMIPSCRICAGRLPAVRRRVTISPGGRSGRCRSRSGAPVPPETPLALAPAPGVQRVLRAAELRRLAERWKLAGARPRSLRHASGRAGRSAERLLAAMQQELPDARHRDPRFQPHAGPRRRTRCFRSPDLRQTPAGGYWNGYVRYAGKQRFAVWARVKVQVTALARDRRADPHARRPGGARRNSASKPARRFPTPGFARPRSRNRRTRSAAHHRRGYGAAYRVVRGRQSGRARRNRASRSHARRRAPQAGRHRRRLGRGRARPSRYRIRPRTSAFRRASQRDGKVVVTKGTL